MPIYFKVISPGRSNRVQGKYHRLYRKGTIVEGVPGSLGLFLFRRLKDAIAFSGHYCKKGILRVKTLTRSSTPKYASDCLTEYSLDRFYSNHPYVLRTDRMPKGTICCMKVQVID